MSSRGIAASEKRVGKRANSLLDSLLAGNAAGDEFGSDCAHRQFHLVAEFSGRGRPKLPRRRDFLLESSLLRYLRSDLQSWVLPQVLSGPRQQKFDEKSVRLPTASGKLSPRVPGAILMVVFGED